MSNIRNCWRFVVTVVIISICSFCLSSKISDGFLQPCTLKRLSPLVSLGLEQPQSCQFENKCAIPPRTQLHMSYGLQYGRGRIALVTGAARGLGRCIAETLGKTGMQHIICIDRTAAACQETVDSIKAGTGGGLPTDIGGGSATAKGVTADASAYGVDVSDPKAVNILCNTLLDSFGHIDVLVNNAGITKDNLFMRMKEREWLDVINVNLNSAFYFSSPLIKRMLKNKFGRIINMSSVVGVGGNPGQSNYAASKAGLIGFTKSLAKEVASRNITVNAIAPGLIKTLMTDAMTDEAKEAALSSVPAGRLGFPQEVADLTAFLASDNAAYLNGKVIPLDGAMLFGNN